jgi:hypothetical protein
MTPVEIRRTRAVGVLSLADAVEHVLPVLGRNKRPFAAYFVAAPLRQIAHLLQGLVDDPSLNLK